MFLDEPESFASRGDVVGCFVRVGDRFLLLHRSKEEAAAHTWGLPAGKVEPGEPILAAACREVSEETGLSPLQEQLTVLPSVFVRHDGRDFMFHMFEWRLETEPAITLRPDEHQNYRWLTVEEALAMQDQLIHDLDGCIRLVEGM